MFTESLKTHLPNRACSRILPKQRCYIQSKGYCSRVNQSRDSTSKWFVCHLETTTTVCQLSVLNQIGMSRKRRFAQAKWQEKTEILIDNALMFWLTLSYAQIFIHIYIYTYLYLTHIKANWDAHSKYPTETLVYNMAKKDFYLSAVPKNYMSLKKARDSTWRLR